MTSTSLVSANAADRRRALDAAVASITKQFGQGSITALGSSERAQVSVLSTGSIAIDHALGVGGLPKGRVVEIYGPESSGKTTFCLRVIAEAQKRGGVAAFVDVEHALDPKYARVCGVQVDDLLVSQPDSGEDALNIAEALIRSGSIDVIIVDSVAALVSKQELDGQMGDATVGSQARLMSQAMRRLTAVIHKTNCICIFTNQIREKIGVMFGSPETTPGGRALKFFASVRMDIRRRDQLKDPQGTVIGNRTKIKVVKNKVAPPYTEAEFDILYAAGISNESSLVELGISTKVLDRRGAWISFNGDLVGQGAEAARRALVADPALASTIETAVRERLSPATAAKDAAKPEEVPADGDVALPAANNDADELADLVEGAPVAKEAVEA